MRLLLDEMLGPKVAEQLTSRGFDVEAVVLRAELRAASDEVVLTASTAEQRVLVTLDVGDFAFLAASWTARRRPHAGIVMVTSAAFPQGRAFLGQLVDALELAAQRHALPGLNEVHYLRPVGPVRQARKVTPRR